MALDFLPHKQPIDALPHFQKVLLHAFDLFIFSFQLLDLFN